MSRWVIALSFLCALGWSFSAHSSSIPHKVVGVELLIADEGAQVQSSFGHALIRLVDDDGLWANDTVISFAANVTDQAINPVTGVFGGYEIMPEALTLQEYWQKYAQVSGRGFTRFPINMSPEELDSFLETLKLYLLRPELLGDYKFITNNCVSIITQIFNEAGLTADRDDKQYVPRSAYKWVDANAFSAFAPLRARAYTETEEYLKANPALGFDEMVSKFDRQELAYAYLNYPRLDFDTAIKLGELLQREKIDADDLYGLKPLPALLYTKEFDSKFAGLEREFFGPEGAKENSFRRFALGQEIKHAKAPLAQVSVPTHIKATRLASIKLRPGQSLERFKLVSAKDGINARVSLRESGSIAGVAQIFQIQGLKPPMRKLDRKTFQFDRGRLQLIEKRDSLELFWLE